MLFNKLKSLQLMVKKRLSLVMRRIFLKEKPKDGKRFRVTKAVGKLVERYSGGECLDAGCGSGAYFPLFRGERVFGLDLTEKYLEVVMCFGDGR